MEQFKKAIFIAIACCLLCGTVHAQSISLKMNNITVKQAIDELKRQSGYSFVFSSDDLNTNRRISVSAEGKDIDKAIRQIIQGQNVSYTIKGKDIIISKIAQKPQGPMRTVKGRVLDAAGEGVIGANVVVKGMEARGVITDIDGNFALEAPSDGILQVSYIGYQIQLVQITGKPLTIQLKEDAGMLDEVMVVAFGKQTRESFTGSAGVIKSDNILKQQVSNPISALNGKVAGVQMVESSSLTGNPTIRIRGLSSINASNSPLIILDGLPYHGYWNDINPADVESITVLKDAASNALYGARGANGVILVTTKAAKRGKAVISLDAKWGVNSNARVDYDYIKDPGEYYEAQYAALYNYYRFNGTSAYQAHVNANDALGKGNSDGGLGYIVYDVPNGEYLIGENGRLNPHATLGNVINYNGMDYLVRPDDWKKEGLRNGLRQEYNFSVNGGNDAFQFYGSLGYMKAEGLTYGNDYQRYTARMKADYQATSWLRIGGNMSYSHADTNSKSSAYDAVYTIAPIYPVYIRDGQGNILTDANGKVYDYGDGANAGLIRPTSSKANPLQQDLLDRSSNNSNGFNVQGYADITFLKDFKLTLNASVYDTENRITSANNPFYGYNAPSGGIVSATHYRTLAVNLQQLLNYNRKFGKHNINLLLGHEYNRSAQTGTGGTKRKVFSYYENLELDGAIIKDDITGYSSKSNNEGYIFRGQYDYDDKYYFSGSFRRDGSSTFHPDHRWGNFWSLGGAWIISKENWFNVDWLDMLKFKISYGEQGNDGIGDYRYVDTYSIGSSNDELSLTFSSKGKEDITWETNGNFNTGFEFQLWKNRLSGSVEYFYRKTSDMLFFFSAPVSLGYSGYYDNIGDMANQGIEVDLNADVVRTKDITWNLNVNLTHYKNKVTYLPGDKKQTEMEGHKGYLTGNYFVGEGLPYYTWYLKKYAGVSPQGEAMYYYTDDNGEMQKTTTYDNGDYYLCGNAMPTLYGGFGTTLTLYGFDLTANFLYSVGGKVYDSGYASLMSTPYSGATGTNKHKDIWKAWSPENPTSNIPRWQYDDRGGGYTSDRWLIDGSSLTFKTLSVGYTLPQRWVKKMKLNKLRVYAACENVAYWSKRKGLDPRTSFSGSTSSSTSPIRTISGGINVTF